MMPEAYRRVAVVCLPGLRLPLAEICQTRQWLYGLGLLAWLVPGGATQYDPSGCLSRRPFRFQHHGRIHPDPYVHRLVDVGHSR